MSVRRHAWAALIAACGTVVVLASLGASSAFAKTLAPPCSSCRPWWHVRTSSAPAATAGGEATVQVDVTNLGDAKVNSPTEPVTIVDTLPPGVTVTEHEGEPRIVGQNKQSETPERMQCELAGQKVSCTYAGAPLLPYEPLLIKIAVKVAPGTGSGQNEVRVEGGGVPSLVSRHDLGLGDSPPPFGIQNYELTPEEEGGAIDTQAGSHPFQLTTTFTLNAKTIQVRSHELLGNLELIPGAEAVGPFTKDLHFNLPPGLVGNPTPLPKCSMSLFVNHIKTGLDCPDDSVVGVATSVATGAGGAEQPHFIDPIFSLEPGPGEPARFGFYAWDVSPVILDTSVRTGGDYGVVVSVTNITESVELMGAQVTFWGVPGDPRHDTARGTECLDAPVVFGLEFACAGQEKLQPFLVMPTSCTGPLHTSVEAGSWEQPDVVASKEYSVQNGEGEPLAQDGCNHLSFNPSISVMPDGTQGSSPTGLGVDVHVPQDASLNPTGLAESALKDTTVALPAGVVLNPAAADGLLACGLGEIALEGAAEQTCPEASKVGTVKIKTPLLPNELEGAAYLAAQNANPFGSLVALYLSVYDPVSGVRVRLAGEVKPDPVTGQLVSTFKNTPQLPFEDLTLHFFGGSRAPLGTPAACGSYSASASFAPWSGNAAANVVSPPFNITSGPGGSPCSSPLPFSPVLNTGSLNLQSGAFTPLTTTMSREDGEQPLQGVQLHFPPGLSGLLSGVALCGEQQANEGTCGSGSLIGETTVSVGVGSTPFAVKGGRVYITGPYKGAPFGLSIVNPAKAGPFDLGTGVCDCVVVRAKVDVDPSTAALTITTDNTGPYKIPTILQGIPLQIKHVNVLITRPGFTINPTNCSKMSVTGNLLSTEGASSSLSVPFQVTNCATLKFTPKFSVSTSGKTSKANGASLTAKLTYPPGSQGKQANITRVKVDLPKQLPSRLTTLQKACTNAQFQSNPAGCPAASIIGHAKVLTPLLPVPLTGPAYFVSHGGEAFPSLTIVLQGYGVTVDLVGTTFINKAGITSTTFKTVPDTPFDSFELTLPQGPYSALAAPSSLCKSKLSMPSEFVAQNGLVIHQSTPISVSGCKKQKLTRKQKLAAALKACKRKARGKRAGCARAAHRRFGGAPKRKKG